MLPRSKVSLTILSALTILAVAAPGCSSKKSRGGAASTVAPSTSGTTGPVATTTTPGTTPAPVTTSVVTPPPQPQLGADAMVSSFQLREVIQVDARAGTIASRFATGEGPSDVANKLQMTYVSNAISQDITVIDRLANNTVATIDVTATPVTGLSLLGFLDPVLKPMVRPTGLAVTPSGNKVFSANLLNVTVIDTTTLAPTKSILGLNRLDLAQLLSNPGQAISNFFAAPVKGLGMAKVACTNDYALATSMITGKVMRIDARTDSVVDYIDVGTAPIGIAIANGKAYVACAISQKVYVIDVATGTVIKDLAAGMIPVDVGASLAGDKVYVANAISGDISVIDTAADLVVDTLPAGMSIASIFQQMGITLPSGTSGGIGGLLNGFLQGFTGGLSNPSSFGALITGGSGSLLSPGNLINGLITGFLAYAGLTQQQVAGLNLPGIGIMSVSVAHDPSLICAGNAFLGELAVTEATSRNVSSVTGLTGLGPVDVAAIWPL